MSYITGTSATASLNLRSISRVCAAWQKWLPKNDQRHGSQPCDKATDGRGRAAIELEDAMREGFRRPIKRVRDRLSSQKSQVL